MQSAGGTQTKAPRSGMVDERLRICPVVNFRVKTYSPTLLNNTNICTPAIRAIGYMRCCSQLFIYF